jgi:Cell wall-active antibiotics response 4TMS YvqF
MTEERQGEANSSPPEYHETSRTMKPLLIVGAILLVVGLLGSLPIYEAEAERTTTSSGSDTFDDVAIMGGVKRSNVSSDFKGGEATAIMGGVEIDLRKAAMERDEAVLDVSSVMGGVKVRVPENWTVISKVDTFMGGFKDHTRHPGNEEHRLILKGTVVMGGLEISN